MDGEYLGQGGKKRKKEFGEAITRLTFQPASQPVSSQSTRAAGWAGLDANLMPLPNDPR